MARDHARIVQKKNNGIPYVSRWFPAYNCVSLGTILAPRAKSYRQWKPLETIGKLMFPTSAKEPAAKYYGLQ